MPPITVPTGHGSQATFGSAQFLATQTKKKVTGVDPKEGRIDISTLEMPVGSKRRYQDAPLLSDSAGEITFTLSYLGTTEPDTENVQMLAFPALNVSGMARCNDFELEAAVGDVIKGTATFTMEPPDDTTP
jgi:hypothetical protein